MTSRFIHRLKTVIASPAAVLQVGLNRFANACAARWFAWSGRARLLESRPPNALAPVWSDLFYLHWLIKRRKPGVVLEFGSGCSTLVMAQALYENALRGHEGKLVSVDASRHWACVTAAQLPVHLKELASIHFSELEEVSCNGVPGFRHRDIPDVNPDMVYIDGPALSESRRVAVDVVDLEERFPSDVLLVVDGRREQCEFLRENLPRSYNSIHNWLLFNTTFARRHPVG